MAPPEPTKKVVKATEAPATTEPTWKPRPEDRAKANQNRIVAIVLWVVAIAIECVAIFGLLLQQSVTAQTGEGAPVASHPFLWTTLSDTGYMIVLIGLIVLCGILSVIGSQLWKKANRADPASEKNKLRFFVQNQLGMILALIAFIPLLVLVAMDKNLKGAQKGIVTGVAALVLLVTVFAGIEFNPSSSEQYGDEVAVVMAINGKDEVFWVKGGKVYHLCPESADLGRPSQDNQIYAGTVGQAHAAGKERLTLKSECGYPPE